MNVDGDFPGSVLYFLSYFFPYFFSGYFPEEDGINGITSKEIIIIIQQKIYLLKNMQKEKLPRKSMKKNLR